MKRNEVSPTNQKALNEFKLHDKAINNNPNTLYNHKTQLRMFFSRINVDWDKVNQRVLDEFFANAKIAVTTKEIMKPVLKAFYIFHKKKNIAKLIRSNANVLAKPTKGEESVLTPEEINRLIECHHDLARKAFIETFVVTGARKEEVRMLNLGDVKIDGNLVWVNIRKPKGDANPNVLPRNIPIAPATDNPVARYPEH
ncbi:MAG: tyrosine-type recombinase/integrase, partial [Thermoplasmatales archaeon]|nr:tyrosine-type recombinase/integrase [Thermoplasmatales archaeon]